MIRRAETYLLSGQPTELDRLQLQSRVWEPAGRALLAKLSSGAGKRALDVGCGVLGWLRLLNEWVGPAGSVVGSDIDVAMIERAAEFVRDESLHQVELVRDDLFATALEAQSFDLVHARFQLAPLGRAAEQMTAYHRLLRPGGLLVMEEPEIGSWRVNRDAPSVARLIGLIEEGFVAGGGDFNAGRSLPELFRASFSAEPQLDAHVIALAPGHPYLRLPLQFAASLRPRLERLIGRPTLDQLLEDAERELRRDEVWGTTFTLVQAWAAATEPS